MTKDVLVAVKGTQMFMQNEEDAEPIETIMAGDYYNKNGKHYIIYEEVMEGFEGSTKNIVKLNKDSVDITKKGITNVHMVFEKNKNNVTCYQTPYGNIMVGINAKSIDIKEEDERILVDLDYALEFNCEHLADCNIHMDIKSKENVELSL